MANKLWILKPTTDVGWEICTYDCCWGFVIEAETEQRAREIANHDGEDEVNCGKKDFWLNPDYSICKELKPDGEEGVILCDFHAG